MTQEGQGGIDVLLVTGMSGAGKSSALKALEDMGFEAIDNVPLSFLSDLVAAGGDGRRVALGVDARTRDFVPDVFLKALEELRAEKGQAVQLAFLDCDDEELNRRYAETRHRHPLALDRPVSDGIQIERGLLTEVRRHADIVLDTTGLGPGHLKRMLQGHVGNADALDLAVFVTSFAYRHGLPRAADLVFDVRFLNNPYYDPAIRALTGRDQRVKDHILKDPDYHSFIASLTGLLDLLVPRYEEEGKSYLTIAVGCTGGRHRSVFVAEEVAAWLTSKGRKVHLHHRELEQAGKLPAGEGSLKIGEEKE